MQKERDRESVRERERERASLDSVIHIVLIRQHRLQQRIFISAIPPYKIFETLDDFKEKKGRGGGGGGCGDH